MSIKYYHDYCNRYRGRAVEIRTRDGKFHRGIIERVDGRHVYIRPLGNRRRLGGFGYGFFGPVRAAAYGVALGTIIGISLLPFFWW